MSERALDLVTDDEQPEEKKPAEPRTIKLRTPIQFGKNTITELTVRLPKAKDFRGLQTRTGYEMDTALTMASRLTGQPNPVIDELTGEDFGEVMEVVNDFIEGFRKTGVKPSGS